MDANMLPPNQTAYRCMWCVMTFTSIGFGWKKEQTSTQRWSGKPLPTHPHIQQHSFYESQSRKIIIERKTVFSKSFSQSLIDINPARCLPSVAHHLVLRLSSDVHPPRVWHHVAYDGQNLWTSWIHQRGQCSRETRSESGMKLDMCVCFTL